MCLEITSDTFKYLSFARHSIRHFCIISHLILSSFLFEKQRITSDAFIPTWISPSSYSVSDMLRFLSDF